MLFQTLKKRPLKLCMVYSVILTNIVKDQEKL